MTTHKTLRILGIYPTPDGFAYAVLESPDRLIDWASIETSHHRLEHRLTRANQLINRYSPDLLVTENPQKSPQRSERARLLAASLLMLAVNKRLRRRALTREQLRKHFSNQNASTKDEIARAIADRLPELQARVPPIRKPGMREHPRMAIFDAIALAMVAMASA